MKRESHNAAPVRARLAEVPWGSAFTYIAERLKPAGSCEASARITSPRGGDPSVDGGYIISGAPHPGVTPPTHDSTAD